MSNLCKSVAALIQAVAGSLHPLITTRSTDGVLRYYRPSANTTALRTALLVTAVQQAKTDDVIKLEAGAFEIGASLVSQLPPGVTGVSVIYGPGVTYHYTNNEHSVPDYGLFPWPQPVGNFIQLQSALSGVTAAKKERDIQLIHSIDITAHVAVPFAKTITTTGKLLRKAAGGSIDFRGILNEVPKQVFSGFGIAEVTGPLRNEEIYPEWWGLIDNNHDIAINCALRTSGLLNNEASCVVKLGPRPYYTSHEIDMGFSQATLKGCGGSMTQIIATSAWTANIWMRCEVWPIPGGGYDGTNMNALQPHGAIIWMGNSDPDRQYSFRSKIIGIDITVNNASFSAANWGVNRISGISARYGVEEGSIIQDCSITYPSGFHIGFARHFRHTGTYAGLLYPAATVNGLDISQVWLAGTTHRDSVAVYFSAWTNNCTLRNSTVAPALAKSVSAAYDQPGVANQPWSAGGAGDLATYPHPATMGAQICDYPFCAIFAQGNVTIFDIHIEGPVVGVFIKHSVNAPSNVKCTNIKGWAMMDPARNAIYALDGRSGLEINDTTPPDGVNPVPVAPNFYPPLPAWNPPKPAEVVISGTPAAATEATTDPYKYSSIVLIGGRSEVQHNWADMVTLEHISPIGACSYVVRDPMYGIHFTPYHKGEYSEAGGMPVRFYSRGSAYTTPGHPGTPTYPQGDPSGGAVYNLAAPAVDRNYFVGPYY